MNHPEYLFERSPEQALIDPNNLLILLSHLKAAAFELPIQNGEAFGSLSWEKTAEFLDYLVDEGILVESRQPLFLDGRRISRSSSLSAECGTLADHAASPNG